MLTWDNQFFVVMGEDGIWMLISIASFVTSGKQEERHPYKK